MYFFFHLVTGIILGLLIGDILDDRRWILPCAMGAILPDLIDKPVGYILFPTTIGYGRIFAHTLFVAILVLALGIVIWKMLHNPVVLGLGIGILSHQILDQMWRQPVNWYYPLFGPFKGETMKDYFFVMFLQELNNPYEWCLALLLGAGLAAIIWRHKLSPVITKNRSLVSAIIAVSALLLCSLSGIIIGYGMIHKTLPIFGWSSPDELIIGGIVIAIGAYVVWHWRTIINNM
jgi:hypothetical protein